MPISFERPPVNEVVVGCTFDRVAPLLIPHFGAFWDLVRSEYPLCQHALPMADETSEVALDAATSVPLPRVWFLSADRVRLIQLQTDRFYCNWRQSEKHEPYSRFDSVYGAYRNHLETLQTFLATQLDAQIRQRRLAVTYVNLFVQGREWTTHADVPQVFKEIRIPSSLRSGVIEHWALKSNWALQGGPGKLTLAINPAKSKSTGQELLRVELSAGCDVAELGDMSHGDWFELAHQAIVQGFCELTTDEVQRVHWGRFA